MVVVKKCKGKRGRNIISVNDIEALRGKSRCTIEERCFMSRLENE